MNVITSKATAENTKNYLDALKDKIRVHGITSLQFRESNDFFFTDEKAGFIPCQLNKKHSGFDYRYQLPKQETDSDDFLSGKVNLLNLKALKLQEFKGIDTQFASFAHIHKDYMLLLSQVSEFRMNASLIPIDRNMPSDFSTLNFDLKEIFTHSQQVDLVFSDPNCG